MLAIFARAAGLVLLVLLEHGELRDDSDDSRLAGAAGNLRLAVGVFADEFALRLRALRLVALPVALGLFANGLKHEATSHSGLGAWQWVTQCGCLQIVTHFGQSMDSQALSGHLI